MFRHWTWASRFRHHLRNIVHNVTPIIYWSPAVLFVTTQLYVPLQITGRSMQPILNPDSSPWRDIGIFNSFSGRINPDFYRKGDIVALRSPENPRQTLVKRITATERETVSTLPPYPDSTVRIPEGHVWVQGDEPFHSDDSNLLGPVPAALIKSKLVWIVWPPSRFGPPPQYDPTSRNDDIYRHAMATFEKDRARSAKVTFDGVAKY